MRKYLWIAAASLALIVPAHGQNRIVNVYNWSDYVDPAVLDDFTRETGIRVVYDTYDSNETLETKLLAGKTGYDIVVPSATFLQRQIQVGVYQKLDKAKIPNLRNLSGDVMGRLAVYDPGNQFAVNYMWFTTGIAYNVGKTKARTGDKIPDSWDYVFKPENLRKFADCGVYFLDSPEDIFASALRFLGSNPDSKNPADLRKAADAIMRVKPSIKKFHSSEYINALASGDICLAVGWAGDSFQARNRAQEARNGVEIDYVIPKEGTLISLDNLAIPKDAEHVTEAHALIDFLLRPEVAARNSKVTNFANPVDASKKFLPQEITENRSIYPDEAVMKRIFTVSAKDQATQKVITREWTRVKTGR